MTGSQKLRLNYSKARQRLTLGKQGVVSTEATINRCNNP